VIVQETRADQQPIAEERDTMTAQLADQVNELQWWHTIDLGNGVVTPGKYPPSGLNLKAFDRIDFTGKRVLDIGCWDGLWAFEAEKRGAAEIYATDDVSQRTFHNTRTFNLAKDILQSKAQYFPETPIEALPSLGVKFDVVLFLGVYYHLRDPLRALGILRSVLNDGGLIVVEGPVSSYSRRKSTATFLYKNVSNNDPSNWWLPSLGCLEEWIESSFFRAKAVYTHTNMLADRSGWPVYAARRVIEKVAPKQYIRTYHGRTTIVAEAISGRDPRWLFPDPLFAGIDGNTYG
jgi:tRNA (mo5U34)-methyltransferase